MKDELGARPEKIEEVSVHLKLVYLRFLLMLSTAVLRRGFASLGVGQRHISIHINIGGTYRAACINEQETERVVAGSVGQN
jgi:hypothetical protein